MLLLLLFELLIATPCARECNQAHLHDDFVDDDGNQLNTQTSFLLFFCYLRNDSSRLIDGLTYNSDRKFSKEARKIVIKS